VSFWVYILKCADGSYYTGHTEDIEARLAQHQQGLIFGYTSKRRPVELVFFDYFQTRDDAFDRERQIKGWSRRKKEALINEKWDELIEFSRNRMNRPSTSSG
jgi:predicted GIY-YIG superfamily endonuclease